MKFPSFPVTEKELSKVETGMEAHGAAVRDPKAAGRSGWTNHRLV